MLRYKNRCGSPQSESPDSDLRRQRNLQAFQSKYERPAPKLAENEIPALPMQAPLFRALDDGALLDDSLLNAAETDPGLLRDIVAAVEQAGPQADPDVARVPIKSASEDPSHTASTSRQPFVASNHSSQYVQQQTSRPSTSIPSTSFQTFQAQANNKVQDSHTSDSDEALFEEVRLPSGPFVAPSKFTMPSSQRANPQVDLTNAQTDSDEDTQFDSVPISRPTSNPTQSQSRPASQVDLSSGLVQRDFAQTEKTSPAKPPPAPPISSSGPPNPTAVLTAVAPTIQQNSYLHSDQRPPLVSRRTSSTSQGSFRSRSRQSQSPMQVLSRTPSRSPVVSRSTSLISRPTMIDDVRRDDARDYEDQVELDDGPSLIAAALAQESSESESDGGHQPSPRRPAKLPHTPSKAAKADNMTSSRKLSTAEALSQSAQEPAPVTPAGKDSGRHQADSSSLAVTSASSDAQNTSMPKDLVPASRPAKSPVADKPIAWSPSPEPSLITSNEGHAYVPDDFPLAEPGRELDEDEVDAADLEEAELQANLMQEEGHFAKFLHDLHHRNLDDMRNEVEEELRTLQAQKVKDRRNADDVTAQMSKEIQSMLKLFGLPFVVAPMEAEAQCAELVSRSLVDGAITDDSDVFLFGGTRIYKNMFNQNKFVECYLSSDIERELSLTRDKLINLAYFLGSDYTEGLPGVGPVLGMELMNEFPGPQGLVEFRKWWQRVQTGKDTPDDSATPFKRRFVRLSSYVFPYARDWFRQLTCALFPLRKRARKTCSLMSCGPILKSAKPTNIRQLTLAMSVSVGECQTWMVCEGALIHSFHLRIRLREI